MPKGNSGIGQTGPPSGVSRSQLAAMSEAEQINTVASILNDGSMKPPGIDNPSSFERVAYALGMNEKPELMTKEAYDKSGTNDVYPGEIYRGVAYDRVTHSTTDKIENSIKHDDYTKMGVGAGDLMASGLYFTNDKHWADMYGASSGAFGKTINAKIKPTAKIGRYEDLQKDAKSFNRKLKRRTGIDLKADALPVYALTRGLDGYVGFSLGSEVVIHNRGALRMPKR